MRRRRIGTRGRALGAIAAVCLLAPCLGFWSGRSARASVATDRTGERLEYASPVEVLFSPDGARLYVLCQQSARVRVLDAKSYKAIKDIDVGRVPRGFSLSPKGDRLFVANSWDDTISVIDTKTLEVAATWSVGAEPSSVVEDRAAKHLFVANRISNDVAVLDAQTGIEEKRLAAGRGASYITQSPDGAKLFVTHVYPNATAHRTPPKSEITVIDAARAVVTDRIVLPYVAHGFHVAFSADGRLGVAAGIHPKNLVPLAHLEHGGAFADTLTLFGADVGKPVEVPLDELERYAVAAVRGCDYAGQVADFCDLRRVGGGCCDRCAAAASLFAHASRAACAGSFGERELRPGTDCRGARSERRCADARWNAS